MSLDENSRVFVRSRLPWIIGGAAFLLYLVTMNQWVNLRSLPVAAKVAGWDWSIPAQWPLFYTVTYPLRFLPAGIQAISLNIFTALCAGLTLALLARSVALLPHDRTHEQRLRERSEYSLLSMKLAWVPVVLAAAVCGLQLTFWEHATAITGEMFDLLFFAYIIRCLLEYRVSDDERWLSKLALVYGLAVTNNWAMIGFFPGFLAALIWIRGIRFFDAQFLIRTMLLGLAGLLLYLLLPAVWMFKGEGEFTFLEVLRANWANQKMLLVDTPGLRNRALLLALTSVLPVFLIGIRWPTSFGDTNVAGAAITNIAFRVIHLFFLAACIWVAFDPKFSPRALGMGLAFLTFYYLAALAIGYYSGYALLVFSEPPRKQWQRESGLSKLINPVIKAAVLITLVAVPAGLLYKNYAEVTSQNGALLKEFAARTAESLPKGPAYLLSDDPYQLTLLQAHLSAGKDHQYIFVNTRSLEAPPYHDQLRKQYGTRWPYTAPKGQEETLVPQAEIQRIIRDLAASNQVVYLHPSFGYFFEVLYTRPNGLVHNLVPFEQDQVLPPPLAPEILQANKSYWTQQDDFLKKVEEQRETSIDARYVARFYSRAQNTWGVTVQRSGDIESAGRHFNEAFALNTNNLPARVNRDFNKKLASGDTTPSPLPATAEEQFGGYRSWDALLADNGPFDQPEYCDLLGDRLLNQSQYRQSALQFSRVIAFRPENKDARLSLAKALVYGRWVERGLAELDKMEADFQGLTPSEQVNIAGLRAAAFFNEQNVAKAEEILQRARKEHPQEPAVTQSLVDLYRASGQYTNALNLLNEQIESSSTNITAHLQKADLQLTYGQVADAHLSLDRVLALAPRNVQALLYQAFAYLQQKNYEQAVLSVDKALQADRKNIQALMYKGIAHMELKEYDQARDAFDDILTQESEHVPALRNRAILNLLAKRWTEAREDYEQLNELAPRSHAIMYGLAEVAYNLENFDEAEEYYKKYMEYAPADANAEISEEKKKVQARLQELSAK